MNHTFFHFNNEYNFFLDYLNFHLPILIFYENFFIHITFFFIEALNSFIYFDFILKECFHIFILSNSSIVYNLLINFLSSVFAPKFLKS